MATTRALRSARPADAVSTPTLASSPVGRGDPDDAVPSSPIGALDLNADNVHSDDDDASGTGEGGQQGDGDDGGATARHDSAARTARRRPPLPASLSAAVAPFSLPRAVRPLGRSLRAQDAATAAVAEDRENVPPSTHGPGPGHAPDKPWTAATPRNSVEDLLARTPMTASLMPRLAATAPRPQTAVRADDPLNPFDMSTPAARRRPRNAGIGTHAWLPAQVVGTASAAVAAASQRAQLTPRAQRSAYTDGGAGSPDTVLWRLRQTPRDISSDERSQRALDGRGAGSMTLPAAASTTTTSAASTARAAQAAAAGWTSDSSSDDGWAPDARRPPPAPRSPRAAAPARATDPKPSRRPEPLFQFAMSVLAERGTTAAPGIALAPDVFAQSMAALRAGPTASTASASAGSVRLGAMVPTAMQNAVPSLFGHLSESDESDGAENSGRRALSKRPASQEDGDEQALRDAAIAFSVVSTERRGRAIEDAADNPFSVSHERHDRLAGGDASPDPLAVHKRVRDVRHAVGLPADDGPKLPRVRAVEPPSHLFAQLMSPPAANRGHRSSHPIPSASGVFSDP